MAAYKAMTLTDEARAQQRKEHGTDAPFPYDTIVWSEETRA
jgi:hypothetical protein